jgi:hypothetical protein
MEDSYWWAIWRRSDSKPNCKHRAVWKHLTALSISFSEGGVFLRWIVTNITSARGNLHCRKTRIPSGINSRCGLYYLEYMRLYFKATVQILKQEHVLVAYSSMSLQYVVKDSDVDISLYWITKITLKIQGSL